MGFYLIVFSIVLGACGRKNQEDAERLEQISEVVESLYNEEKNDLAADISETKLAEVEKSIEVEKENERNEENENTFQMIESSYQNAAMMFELEQDIANLFTDETIVQEKITQADVENLIERLEEIDRIKWTPYVNRQEEGLVNATEQLDQIQVAKEMVNELYVNEEVKTDVNQEELRIAQERVAKIKNSTIRADLDKRLEKVEQILIERTAAAKAAKSIGGFVGYYHNEEDNFFIMITEDTYEGFRPETDAVFYYEIFEIIHNSGTEISLIIHHDEFMELGDFVAAETKEVHWKLEDNGKYLNTGNSKYQRVTAEEFEQLQIPSDYYF